MWEADYQFIYLDVGPRLIKYDRQVEKGMS